MEVNKPNLFIAGAPKAGTTFLFQKLNNHPDLFFPKIKELNHFSYQDITDLGSYYKDFKIKDRKRYLDFYRKAHEQKYLVDSSVSYFTFSAVPSKISEFSPDPKIVFILRNPIKRAYSHYLMDVRMGYATKPFREYIQINTVHPVHYHQYIGNSMYAKNIQNYLKVFDQKQICVLILENIEADMVKLFNFMEISADVLPIDTSEKINKNKKPKNIISKTLHKNRDLTSRLKMIIPRSISKKFNALLYEEEERKEIEEHDATYLAGLFHADVQQLSSILNKDLNSFWKI